jgi:glycosyltransferase involved in cell wall biosynthesis
MQPTPVVTLVVLAYRQADLIDAAIDSALAQTGAPIEILLSDDASPDATYARMQARAASYNGPHQLVVRRNATNLGLGEHVNQVMRLARGELVILMAGDDISLPERAERVAAAWEASGRQVDLVASHVIDMAHDGTDLGVIRVDDLQRWSGIDAWAAHRPHVIGAAHAVTRRLHERFGPFAADVSNEDQINTLRALCAGGACTIDAPLVRYRRGGMSGRHVDADGTALRIRAQRSTARHLALHRQWQHDAEQAGCLDRLRQATDREEQRELFLQTLLSDPHHRPALTNLWWPPYRVSFSWRLGKWLRFSMADLSARMEYFKSRRRHPA